MIQTGVIDFGPQTSGWNLGAGTGQRSFTSQDIGFNPPFGVAPAIALALSGIDSDHATNLRLTLNPYDVQANEFNIQINTWDDTLLYSVVVTWIAYD
jgi:hypothetical protein